MSILSRKLQLAGGLSVLLLLAVGVSCKGFFVNSPDSLTISPNSVTFSQVGSGVQQLTAQATFGTKSQDVTANTVWRSSNGCVVVPSTTVIGQMTDIGTGSSVTITATYNGVSDTVTATVPAGISITPCSSGGKSNGTFASGSTVTLTATSGGSDVTSTTNRTSDNDNVVSFANPGSSVATFGPTKGTATITASSSPNTGELFVTVQ